METVAVDTMEEIQAESAVENATEMSGPARRGRGRPKGSKNKPKPDMGFVSAPSTPKRIWTRRKAAVSTQEFMDTIVTPIMGQVAAGHLKKNVGMIIAAICGRLSSLYITTTTPPLQTLSSDITRFKKQPVYQNETVGGSKQVVASQNTPEEVQIPVYAQFNEVFNAPLKMVDRFVALCQEHGINHEIFTTKGGTITLTTDFLTVVTKFASDKELWDEKPLIAHTTKQ